MALPEVLYGKREHRGMIDYRFGSARIGAVLNVIRWGAMPTSYLGSVGHLNFSYGPAGGVEAGIDGIPAEQRGWERIAYLPSGMAVALNWTRPEEDRGET